LTHYFALIDGTQEVRPEGLYYGQLDRLESVPELVGPDRSTRYHLTVCNYALETQRTDV
jgi:hypothetical protein